VKSVLAAARLLASKRERSVPIADCYDVRVDPSGVFAIVPMRVVGEEVIQAVGYGDINVQPNIVVEHQALSRRTAFLEPFGEALNDYLTRTVEEDFPRIYIPHPAALEVLTILAARYERSGLNPNPNPRVQGPSPVITRLGYQCRLLKDIYHMPGQQIVVVMTEAIRRHFVSGQIPPKDGHLGALTIWLDPPAGLDTQRIADRSALDFPAAAMLPRPHDDAVEKNLHRIRKSTDPLEQQRLQSEIENMQRLAVQSEWTLLQNAHVAFWNRKLASTLHDDITSENTSWLRYRLTTQIARARMAVPMSRRYELHEYHDGLHRVELIDHDHMRFNQERADGNAFIGSITAIRKTPRGVNPKNYQIDIAVDFQPKIRLRPGRKVRLIGGSVVGEIRFFQRTPVGYDLTLNVTKGVNSLAAGGPFRWADDVPRDLHTANSKYHQKVKQILGMP